MSSFTFFFLLFAPVPIVAWMVFSSLGTRRAGLYSLFVAMVCGGLLQAQVPGGHPHVPGSSFLLFFVPVFISAVTFAVLITFRSLLRCYKQDKQ